jgi:hypothetical protein
MGRILPDLQALLVHAQWQQDGVNASAIIQGHGREATSGIQMKIV